MSKYKIYTRENLTKEMYLKTWELDNRTFDKKDRISKKLALEWFKCSGGSTAVLWDEENDCLIGYVTAFLLNHNFSKRYIISNENFKKAITAETFCDLEKDKSGDIYFFSIVVEEEYRGRRLVDSDTTSTFHGRAAVQVLTEALCDWVCYVKEKGISINYIYAEKVNDAGEKYLRSLGLQPCFNIKDDVKFAKLFTPKIFSRCRNRQKLFKLYQKKASESYLKGNLLEGHEYLSFKDGYLHYKDINLYDLVKKYGAPLEVGYTPIIKDKILYMKNLFAKKIKKYKYGAKYNYTYATKANYYSETVLTALNHIDMLEISSAYDIDLMIQLARKGYLKKGYTIICNGFKNERYISSIKTLLDLGMKVIPVIENSQELELLKKLNKYKLSVGLRYNSDFESRLIKNNFKEEEYDNRFGFNKEEIMVVAKEISKIKNFSLEILHFHFGGTITDIDNYIKGFGNIFYLYCQLKQMYPTLRYFDFGGGFPIKYSLTYKFDYEGLVDKMVKSAKRISDEFGIDAPELIGEHGRYTAGDSSFFIYKIDFKKEGDFKNWYIINGSLMNMTPDMWGIQQDFTILPVNLLGNKCIPACLGGETCDPDDRYYLQDKNVELFMPQIKKGETLYIAIFSVGAYQEIISGIGGVHHCLIPEGKELIIYENEEGKLEYYEPSATDETEKALTILDYVDDDYMNKFYNK